MIVKLLTEHYLEFLRLKRGCRGASESTHVKMPHCWKSHALAHMAYRITVGTQDMFGVFDVNGDATDASASDREIPA